MARTELLTQSYSHSDLPSDTQIVDTNTMGGCITVVLKTAHGLRAQHCAGGIAALTHDFWDLAEGDDTARAVIVGVPTGYDQDRIDDHISDCGVAHVAHLSYSRALVHVGLMATASSADQVAMSVVRKH